MLISRGTLLRASAVLGIGAGLLLGGSLRSPLIASTPPSPLVWETSSGSIDVSKLPAVLPALDCEGNVVGTITNPFSGSSQWEPRDAEGDPCGIVELRYDEDYETEVGQP